MRFSYALAVLLWLAAHEASIAQENSERSEAPVRQVDLSNGTRRYTVPIRVGETDVEAGLDTGSTGLRLLPSAVPPDAARASGRRATYAYGSGTRLHGVIGQVDVGVGAAAGRVPVQLVRSADCVKDKPLCGAARAPFERFGIQGDGLPGEGFKAILGVNMGDDDAPNPLLRLGVKRWIVELPRPGERGPGRLILNPTAEETQGFVFMRIDPAFKDLRGGLHDAVRGCLVYPARGRTLCGPMLMDTGAPGLNVRTPNAEPAWPDGARAQIVFADMQRPVTQMEVVIGSRQFASRFHAETVPELPTPRMMVGLAPYFMFSVLYVPEEGLIGLKPRD